MPIKTDNQLTELLNEIKLELQWAEEKHPVYPGDLFQQLAIIQEEAGELTKAAIDYTFHDKPFVPIRAELIQTAAACVRMLKHLPS